MKIAVVGAGLYGATVAYLARQAGHEVTVYEEETQLAGNIRSHWDPRINAHTSEFGAHIFHTNSQRVWNFVNRFTAFNSYKHYVKGWTGETMLDLPFNMSLFNRVLGVRMPVQAKAYFDKLRAEQKGKHDETTVEGWCLANIGPDLYEAVVMDYTRKQWGRSCSQLPASIIQRLPIRYDYDSTYFHNARWQGMPVDGYTAIVERMLEGIPKILNDHIRRHRMHQLEETYDRVYFSGMLDRLQDYVFGELEYRGLHFESQYMENVASFQGAPVVNDLTPYRDYTRIIEHKHFYPEKAATPHTLITEEYPKPWKRGQRAYYPVRDENNLALYSKYEAQAAFLWPKMRVGGRLGAFQYMDMDQVVGMAMAHTKDLE
jgi:UDP-galactopyranose mutase